MATRRSRSRTGGLLLSIFALPFLAVGVGATLWMYHTLFQIQRAKGWTTVPARILSVDLKLGGDDSTTYRVLCRYRYALAGQSYESTRVGFIGGSDNVGSWQRATYQRLEQLHRRNEPVTCYVNPRHPQEAVLDREPRFSMIVFGTLFATLFGSVGVGLVSGGLHVRRSAGSTAVAAETPDQPWLERPEWASGLLRPGLQVGERILWLIAAFWTLACVPLLCTLPQQLTTGHNPKALWAFPFPFVAVILLSSAVRATARRRKFGNSFVQLATVPGVIGGHLRGKLVLAGNLDALQQVALELRCVRTITSGSGDNSSTQVKVLWSDELEQETALAFGQTQIDVPFDFQIPYSSYPTDDSDPKDVFAWKLAARGELPGVDLSLTFEVPVFKTEASDPAVGEAEPRARREAAALASSESPLPAQIRIESDMNGNPAYRISLWPGIGFVAIVFAIAGGMDVGTYFFYRGLLGGQNFMAIFMVVFGLVGLVLTLSVLGMFGRFRLVLRPDGIWVRRTFCRWRSIPLADVDVIDIKDCASAGEKRWFQVFCRTKAGRRYTLATQLRGQAAARWLVARVEEHMAKFKTEAPDRLASAVSNA